MYSKSITNDIKLAKQHIANNFILLRVSLKLWWLMTLTYFYCADPKKKLLIKKNNLVFDKLYYNCCEFEKYTTCI